jgi:hypothetical protein
MIEAMTGATISGNRMMVRTTDWPTKLRFNSSARPSPSISESVTLTARKIRVFGIASPKKAGSVMTSI